MLLDPNYNDMKYKNAKYVKKKHVMCYLTIINFFNR